MQKSYRLNKAIALATGVSRRNADELISKGQVKVNGKVVEDFSVKVTANDKLLVKNKKAVFDEYKYVLLNKPKGYLTTKKDSLSRKTIMDLFPKDLQCLKTGSRLDRDSDGLMVLSNDGDFLNNLHHPSKRVKKIYLVTIAKKIEINDYNLLEAKFRAGVKFENEIYKAESIKLLSIQDKKQSKFEIVLKEGKNRQIRKMFKAFGLDVKRLQRVAIGNFKLEKLKKGQFKEITKDKAYAILHSTKSKQGKKQNK